MNFLGFETHPTFRVAYPTVATSPTEVLLTNSGAAYENSNIFLE